MELRTLKDIVTFHHGYVNPDDVKREAIKWYEEALKQNKGIPKNAITTSDWLEFFNITDEDLK